MPRLILLPLLAYILFVAMLYLFQRTMMYFPPAGRLKNPADYGLPEMSPVRVRTEDGLELVSWFTPPKEKDGRIIMMFHGNGGSISDRPDKARSFFSKGFGLLLCEYRGYGGNPGHPSEQGLYRDGRANLKWLAEQGYHNRQLVLYGESLGTGVAVQMALETQPPALILEAPFSSTLDIARQKYFYVPLGLLMLDIYDSLAKIPRVTSSLLVIHGDKDITIPIRYGEKLFAAANEPKKFITVKGGGHADLYDFKAADVILEWLHRPPANENRKS